MGSNMDLISDEDYQFQLDDISAIRSNTQLEHGTALREFVTDKQAQMNPPHKSN